MQTIRGQKYIWQFTAIDEDLVRQIAMRYNLSLPTARTVLSRGYTTPESIENFLFGGAQKAVNDPRLMLDAQRAADRLIEAIKMGEKILISGDYDVDGITASALVMACLQPLGAEINFFLPHRVKDGYGLSVRTIERAAASGYKIVLTVDNGITAFEPAQRAKQLKVDLIITDHHRVQGVIPEAYAVVNPNQENCTYPYKSLAGVGVVFKLMSLLYDQLGYQLPHKAYELLLLGTVADVVPLTDENRYWVRHGLRYVNSKESLSFSTLKLNGKISRPTVSSLDVGFSIAPQINALGRLEDPRQGVSFLLSSDPFEVSSIGQLLAHLNQQRREIEKGVVHDIVQTIDPLTIHQEKIIVASHAHWPPGVIGLVASRIVGMYGRPTLLFHITPEGIAKGSCRSIAAFNMFDALHSCRDLLLNFGGHSQAAGLSLPAEKLPLLKDRLEQRATELLKPEDFEQKIKVDSAALLTDFSRKFLEDLEYLEPFGHQNPEPVFLVRHVTQVKEPQLLKDAHVKTFVFADGIIKPLIFFNRPELYEWLKKQIDPFDIVVTVKENYWQDKSSIELTGVDVATTGVTL